VLGIANGRVIDESVVGASPIRMHRNAFSFAASQAASSRPEANLCKAALGPGDSRTNALQQGNISVLAFAP